MDMQTSIHRLAYVSRPKVRSDVSFDDLVWPIAYHGTRRSRAWGISGGLFSSPSLFINVLEGPAAIVLRLFECILKDDRHEDVQLIHSDPVRFRLVDDWYYIEMDQISLAIPFCVRAAESLTAVPRAYLNQLVAEVEQRLSETSLTGR